jgi:hypothetical protein
MAANRPATIAVDVRGSKKNWSDEREMDCSVAVGVDRGRAGDAADDVAELY